MIRFCNEEVKISPGADQYLIDTVSFTDDRPIWITRLRIYQRVPYAMSGDTWSVLRDAIIDGDKDAAGQIIASDEIIPGWRRSGVIIDRLLDYSSNRVLVERAIAGSIWDVPIDHVIRQSDCLQLLLSNQYEYPITIRPFFTFERISQRDLDALRAGRLIDPPSTRSPVKPAYDKYSDWGGKH